MLPAWMPAPVVSGGYLEGSAGAQGRVCAGRAVPGALCWAR